MRLRGKPLRDLSAVDLQALADSKVGESKMLEFKRELPGGRDEDRREFLADVTSLANTSGGTIIYGMATARDATGADTGIAEGIAAISGMNADRERLRLLAMLQDGVSPALAAQTTIVPIECGNSGNVLALGVPRSLIGPHMVSFQKRNQFFRRSESGKYLPDVAEVRTMFLESKEWLTEADDFREARIAYVDSGAMNVSSVAPACLVQVLPLGRLSSLIDLRAHGNAINQALPPLRHEGWGGTYNAAGYLTETRSAGGGPVLSYSQCFRFGGTEGFTTEIAQKFTEQDRERLILYAGVVRKCVGQYVEKSLAFLARTLEVEPPFALALTLLRIGGYAIPTGEGMQLGRPIDAATLRLPVVMIDDPVNVPADLTPWYDILWQSSGFSAAPEVTK